MLMWGKRVLVKTFICLLAVASMVAGPVVPAEAASAGLAWTTKDLDVTAREGAESTVELEFAFDQGMTALGINVLGALAEVATVDMAEAYLKSSDIAAVPLRVSMPASSKKSYRGVLQLTEEGQPAAKPLRVRITTSYANAESIPLELTSPSADRVGSLAGAALIVDQVTVVLKPEVTDPTAAIKSLAAKHGAQIVGALPGHHVYDLRFPGQTPEGLMAVLDNLEQEGLVESASYALLAQSEGPTDDPIWAEGPAGYDRNWNLKQIDAPGAWDAAGENETLVGIIDTGFDLQHEDLKSNIMPALAGGSGNKPGHGTHVAGTACAEGNNAIGMTGVARNCQLALQATPEYSSLSQMIESMDDVAAAEPRVVNISMASSTEFDCEKPLNAAEARIKKSIADELKVYKQAVQIFASTLWVFAAGNDGIPASCSAPSGIGNGYDLDNAITVGSVTSTGDVWTKSNFGHPVPLWAPGGTKEQGIYSTLPSSCTFLVWSCNQGNYGYKNGTSMSAPHVTGAAALAFSTNPSLTPREVRNCLLAGASKNGDGYSVLNAAGTVRCATKAGLTGVQTISADEGSAFAIKKDGTLWAWGNNTNGQLGIGSQEDVTSPLPVIGISGRVSHITSKAGSTYAITSDGSLWAWGKGPLGNGSGTDDWGAAIESPTPVKVDEVQNAVSVAVGQEAAYALTAEGRVWAWGKDGWGQQGDGPVNEYQVTPRLVPGLADITEIEADAVGTAYALKADGTLWVWGSAGINDVGQLGLGDTHVADWPTQIQELPNVVDLDINPTNANVVTSDGAVWTWGHGYAGRLGNGDTASSRVPVKASIENVVSIQSSWQSYTYAQKKDGTTWAWGVNNAFWDHDPWLVPVHLAALGSGATTAGETTGYALRSDGTILSWGVNHSGELGSGSSEYAQYTQKPDQVRGLEGIQAVVSGASSAYALHLDGTVWAWGSNSDGQLGNGTFNNSPVPVMVGAS